MKSLFSNRLFNVVEFSGSPSRSLALDYCALSLIAVVTLVLFITGAPTGYNFGWSDAPRHALNGAFVLDLIRTVPIHHPVQFAYNYYAQYPALTILLYPPLYPAMLAISYALFGISQTSALVVNALTYVALGWGTYRLFARFAGRPTALVGAVTLLVAPEIAFWGRQTMTDVPALAFMVLSAWAFVYFLQTRRIGGLYWAGLLAVVAIWIKITVCLIVPAFALTLLVQERTAALRRGHYWMVAALIMVGVLPIIWLTLHFGQTNVASVAGIKDAEVSRYTVSNWIWYARHVPGQLGWPLAVLAALAMAWAAITVGRRRRLPADRLFILIWLLLGYVFFSAIDLKSARFSIAILPPLVLACVWLVEQLGRARPVTGPAVMAAIGVATWATTIIARPVLYVAGYESVVTDVVQRAPNNTNIAFFGYRDGSFIFAMRAMGHRPDLNTIRADKLLLSVNIRRSLGTKQKHKSQKQIADQLTRLKVSYVVAQPGFWDDLAVMKRFMNVMNGSQFKAVARYHMQANYPTHEKNLIIYKNLAKLPAKRPNLSITLPAINQTISQKK